MTHNTSEPIYKRERAPYRKNPDDIVIVYDPVKLFTKEIARNPVTGAVPQSPKGYPGKSFLSQPFIIGWRNIYDLSRILVDLSREPQCAVIRGNPFEAAYRLKTPIVRRYVHAEKETNNYEAVLRRWIAIDTDKLLLAKGMRLAHDPRAVAEWIVRQIALFLPGLDGVTVHVQFTSSAGMHLIPGHPDHRKDDAEEISARIWAVLDRPYSNDELGRWCKAANASWFASLPKPEPGKKAPRPLIDTGPIVNAVGLNYTADPLLIGIAPYLAERSFLIHGSKLEASPVIPTVEAIETFERERGITSSLIPHRIGYVAALDLIGDYAFSGKQGFQDPILAVTRAAVEEHGDGVDVDAVLHDIRDRIARFRGARSDEDVARYGSEAFVFAKLDHYAAKQRVREAEAAARLGGEPRIPAPVLTLEEGQAELERVAAKAIADCLAYARVRHAYEQQKAMFGSDPTTRKVIREYLKKQFGLKKWPRAPVSSSTQRSASANRGRCEKRSPRRSTRYRMLSARRSGVSIGTRRAMN